MVITNNIEKPVFSPTSKLWIYGANRNFSTLENEEIQNHLNEFVSKWMCHGAALVANATIVFNRFIVLEVDEAVNTASGCSIDSSVKFLHEIDQKYALDLMNRMRFYYFDENNKIESVDRTTLKNQYSNNHINTETLIFDTLVQKGDGELVKKLGDSWLTKMI